jgi:hypothetical protein
MYEEKRTLGIYVHSESLATLLQFLYSLILVSGPSISLTSASSTACFTRCPTFAAASLPVSPAPTAFSDALLTADFPLSTTLPVCCDALPARFSLAQEDRLLAWTLLRIAGYPWHTHRLRAACRSRQHFQCVATHCQPCLYLAPADRWLA